MRTITLSVVVPAHNEATLLGGTLDALREAAGALAGVAVLEVIVVDDASTDRTAEVATARGARVVPANVRNIAAARNAGARAARGELLVFVDADTIVPAGVLQAAVAEIRAGAVGGGSAARFDAAAPRWAAHAIAAAGWIMRAAGWAAGCFFFVRRDAFERVGGFDERYFASEEIHLSVALKRLGRFVILREQVMTSGRKAASHTPAQVLWQVLRLLWPGSLRRRERLSFWYGEGEDGPRSNGSGN